MQPRALKCTDAPRSRISVEIERARFAKVDTPLQQCIITRAFHVKVCRNRDSFFFYRTFIYFKRENTANFHLLIEFLCLDWVKSEFRSNEKNFPG